MNSTSLNRTGANQGNLASYATGFVLSIILTALAFSLVMARRGLPGWVILLGIFASAFIQMLVHLYYFLHLNRPSAAPWNAIALAVTVLMMALFICLTLWIMSNLNYRMM